MVSRETTPPDHPAAGLHVSNVTITAILKQCLPLHKISTIDRIPHTRSYNNRVVIIESQDEQNSELRLSSVLKINGRFFGPAKVENEAACLLLLQHFCPELPVPRVLAWSAGGVHISRRDSDGSFHEAALEDIDHSRPLHWILMTKLQGTPLNCVSFSATDMDKLAKQIARAVRAWRHKIPRAHGASSLHLGPREASAGIRELYQTDSSTLPAMHIYGNVGAGNDDGHAAYSSHSFWSNELIWQRSQLKTLPAFTANRKALVGVLGHFIEVTLPRLSLFQNELSQPPPFVFTHTDLVPRNILVSGSPPTLTGIVDFEFSGFFPPMEEFNQDWDPDPSDDESEWPSEMYNMMMTELEKLGDLTPTRLAVTEKEELLALYAIKYFVAPWWIEQGEQEDGEERRRDLERARERVKSAIARLEAVVEKRSK